MLLLKSWTSPLVIAAVEFFLPQGARDAVLSQSLSRHIDPNTFILKMCSVAQDDGQSNIIYAGLGVRLGMDEPVLQ